MALSILHVKIQTCKDDGLYIFLIVAVCSIVKLVEGLGVLVPRDSMLVYSIKSH